MNLSKEHSLQLYCLKNFLAGISKDDIESLITPDLNWDEFLKSAYWHGVDPILYYALKNSQENCLIPKDIIYTLKNSFCKTSAFNTAMYIELAAISEGFSEKGISLIVFKGAALAKTVYSNVGFRKMIDIDILVRKEDLIHAESILKGLGYMFRGNRAPEWYRENYYHMLYANPRKSTLVELHWHVADSSYPSKIALTGNEIIDSWWVRATWIEIDGTRMKILCPEDSVFLLCLHFLKHRFQSPNGGYRGVFTSRNALIQLCDICLALKCYKDVFNWGRFNQELEKHGAKDVIYSTLFLVRKTFDNIEGSFINDRISPSPVDIDEDLFELIEKRLFDRDYVFSLTPMSFFQSILDGNFRKKLKNITSALFPPREMISKLYSLPITSKRLHFYKLVYIYDFIKKNRKRISFGPTLEEAKVINEWIGSD
jgi:hypothetical protein